MKSYLGILSSNTLNRDGFFFTIGALEQGIYDNALTGMPSLVSHDFHRPLGWIYPFGLYIEPKMVKSIGNFVISETDEDFEIIGPKIKQYVNMVHYNHVKDHVDEFKALLGDNYTNDGRFIHDSCAAYSGDKILLKIYPKFNTLKDKDGLIYLDDFIEDFEYVGSGIFKNKTDNFAVFCHQYFKRSLSKYNNFNTYFLDNFIGFYKNKEIKLRIALDENMIGLSKTYTGSFELDYWWGPKFNDDISQIPDGVTRYECDEREKFFSGISGTEFWWKSDGKDRVLEIEEIRETASLGIGDSSYGCRYIHSIYNTEEQEFVHFDGAIRMYDDDKILSRWDTNINKAGKDTTYTKLFRIDGKLGLADWKKLSIYYYHSNPLIYEYFGVKEGYDALHLKEEEKNKFEELIPYKTTNDEGIRLFISYHPPTENLNFKERHIKNTDIIRFPDYKIDVVEYDIIEIKKILERVGETLIIPHEISFLKPYDFYTNFPTILHSVDNTTHLVQKTLEAYKILFSAWNNKIQKTITFSVAWPMGDKEVRLSVYGNLTEVLKWLELNSEIPIDHEDLRIWIEKQSKWISDSYNQSNEDFFELVKNDGVQYIKRKAIDSDWIRDLDIGEDGFRYNLQIPKTETELDKLIQDQKIFPSYSSILKKVTCSKTNTDYFTSTTSKFLDDDVVMIIEECELMGFFWTDKHFF